MIGKKFQKSLFVIVSEVCRILKAMKNLSKANWLDEGSKTVLKTVHRSSLMTSERVASNPEFTRFELNRRRNKRRQMSRNLVIRNHLWLFTNSAISCATTDVRPSQEDHLVTFWTNPNYFSIWLTKIVPWTITAHQKFSQIAETLIPRQIFHDSAENNAWQRFESHLSRKAGEPRRCLLHFLKSTSCCVYLEGESICTLVQLK